MLEKKDLLIELGTEELPPKALKELAEAFGQNLVARLDSAQISPQSWQTYATPRRLTLLAKDVPTQQPSRPTERRGPATSAAFTVDGEPTPAAKGFARSCGVDVEALETLQNAKGNWLYYRSVQPGQATNALIPEMLRGALQDLPIPKRMRWGAGDHEFVRPVHWLLLLLGEDVIEADILGQRAGRMTFGHRYHHPAPISVAIPAEYPGLLQHTGKVVPDFEQRRTIILNQLHAVASSVQSHVLVDPALLDEVTALVEWPVALLGSFDEKFLTIPHEVLVSTMEKHQKYFPVTDEQGLLSPYFVTVSNIESSDPAQVRAGNERVIRPRFADAQFFWEQDCRQPLDSRRQRLSGLLFEQKLGSVLDKSQRVAQLARANARSIGADVDQAKRAAELCKCDLVTNMVIEFPDLQGIMGRYYADHDGESEAVAQAIEQHYLPRHSGDTLPGGPLDCALSLADRADTLVGIFSVGKQPSGNKDPFALRRIALAIVRTIVEKNLDLDVRDLLVMAEEQLPESLRKPQIAEDCFAFLLDRMRSYYLEQGFRIDEFEAVAACRPTRPLDFDCRIRGLAHFRTLESAQSLTAANKRIRNILRAAPSSDLPLQLDGASLVCEAERSLARQLQDKACAVDPFLDSRNYAHALELMSALSVPIDRFFEEVMVMVEDDDLRHNRLALLRDIESLFRRTADISLLQA